MTNTTKPQAAPVEPPAMERPIYTFSAFKWTPDSLPHHTKLPARELCGLVDHVKDVARGASLVFELLSAHDCDIDSENQSYLSPYHLDLLKRMAIRSLESLADSADDIATDLHNLERAAA